MIDWAYFPRSSPITPLGHKIVAVFEHVAGDIDSGLNDHLIGRDFKEATSDIILARVRPGLEQIGFKVEAGKKAAHKISVPVLFGRKGSATRSFEADAFHEAEGFVIEIEAGRAIANNQFLKDLFEACVMVDVNYLAIAVRNTYKRAKDFDTAHTFIDTLYSSDRLSLPLKGVLIIGY